MYSNYEPLGRNIRLVDIRNKNNISERVLGINIDKFFMPSVANVIGTDLSKYKLLKKGLFACNPMHVGRDERLPVALYDENEPGLVSPAYFMFEVMDEEHLIPEYLMMWFRRPEFDRQCWLRTDGSVRGGITWEDLCRMELPVPEIGIQRKAVKAFQMVTDRIELKRKINDNLTETVQAIYRSMFLDAKYQFEHKPLAELCSKIGSGATPKGGKTAYCDTGITLIRSTNVVDYGFIYDGLAHITNEQADALSNVVVNSGDVLFNITGVSVARCCMVPDDVIPARVNQHVMIIRPVMGKDMSYYIMATLCHPENKSKLLGIAQSGSTREAINKQEMEQFTIPVPFETAVHEFGRKVETLFTNISTNINGIRQLLDIQRLLLSRLSSR